MPDEPTPAVSVREWTDVVRRARLGKTVKYVALTLASYADFSDGGRVYPGMATLAYAAEVSYKTAKTAVAKLLRVGLLEVVKAHPGARGRGTEYRLILGEQLLECVEVPSPEQARKGADLIGQAERRTRSTGNPVPRTQAEVQGTPDPVPVDNPVDKGGLERPPAEPVQGTGSPVLAGVQGTPRLQYREPHAARPSIDQPRTTTSHQTRDLRTDVTAPRAGPPEERPKFRIVKDGETGHGFCLQCRDAGQITLAADPINGSVCAHHLRQREAS